MLLDKNIGSLIQRNIYAKLPHEMPHNEILNDPQINKVFKEHLTINGGVLLNSDIKIPLIKEPDYVFVVNI